MCQRPLRPARTLCPGPTSPGAVLTLRAAVALLVLVAAAPASADAFFYCAVARAPGEPPPPGVRSIFDTWVSLSDAGGFETPTGHLNEDRFAPPIQGARGGVLYRVVPDLAPWHPPGVEWFVAWTLDRATFVLAKHHVVLAPPAAWTAMMGVRVPEAAPCASAGGRCGRSTARCTPDNAMCGRQALFDLGVPAPGPGRVAVAWEKSRWACTRVASTRIGLAFAQVLIFLGLRDAPPPPP